MKNIRGMILAQNLNYKFEKRWVGNQILSFAICDNFTKNVLSTEIFDTPSEKIW